MPTSPQPANAGPGNETELTFRSDGLRLQGTLHLPDQPRPHLVVGSHGLYSSGASPKQYELARGCCRMGLAYFRFDHRGCGRSEGRFAEVTTLAGRRNDLVDAVTFLRKTFDLGTGLGLFGSSLGGATCLAAAGALTPQRLVTLAAPVDSRSILAAAKAHEPVVEPLFYKDAFQFDLVEAIASVTGILVIHGDRDDVIPPAHADKILERAGEPKQQLIIAGGDHRLSQAVHQQQFVEATLAWFRPLTQPATTHR